MRIATIILMVALAGCSTSDQALPPSPKVTSLETVGKSLDQIDLSVAASVQVAREMNKAGKPDKVEGELSVAAASLPKADPPSVALARQRAENATASEYEDQRKKAQSRVTELENAWIELEDQAREKDDQIKELKLQVESGKKDIFTITGAGLVVIGGLAWALASWKVGAPLLLAGAFCGAIPHILDSPAFIWTAGATLIACCGIFIWWLFDKARDNINETPNKEIQNR
jgi:ribose/xylose/arabinose/galactoside ABC-type transport system permease subunit